MAPDMTRIGPAREEALQALRRTQRGLSVSDAIQAARPLEASDRALMAQLVYGVLRHRRYLDAWVRPWLRGPLDEVVADILRIGLFQLEFLDRVPSYAAVNAAVEQAKVHKPRAANLVNALLRRAQRERPQGLTLGERYSHPDWLVERWRTRYGDKLETVLAADNEVPPLTVRVNLAATSREAVMDEIRRTGADAQPSPYLPEAVRVSGSIWLEDLEAFQRGWITVQDESGMLVAWILDPMPGDHILDMAAGLGGKALHALEKAPGSLLTALDISAKRLQLLDENLTRTHLGPRVQTVAGPAEDFAAEHPHRFERVILDAPCSGLGVLRRRVDARWTKRDTFEEMAARQRRLLEAALQTAAPGGVVVYSTCSTEPEETQAVLEGVLKERRDWRRRDVRAFLPHPALAERVEEGCLVLAPGDFGMDGFFIARLEQGGQA